MADRRIEDLTPEMQEKVNEWVKQMQDAGIDYLITCTKRTQEEQNDLWAIGRTVNIDHPKVTWTLHSKHIEGLAFDFCILWNGKPDWNMTMNPEGWKKAVEIGKNLGLTQVIGSDGHVKEFAHLQMG